MTQNTRSTTPHAHDGRKFRKLFDKEAYAVLITRVDTHSYSLISARRTSRLVWSVVAAACCLGFLSTHTRKKTKWFSLTRAQKVRPSNARTPLPRKLLHQGNQELGRSVAGKGSPPSRSALSSQTQRASGVLAGWRGGRGRKSAHADSSAPDASVIENKQIRTRIHAHTYRQQVWSE